MHNANEPLGDLDDVFPELALASDDMMSCMNAPPFLAGGSSGTPSTNRCCSLLPGRRRGGAVLSIAPTCKNGARATSSCEEMV